MVREQECGYSRREEKQGAKGNESTLSVLTRQATVSEHGKAGGSDRFSWQQLMFRQSKVKSQVWGPPRESSQETRLQQQPRSMTAGDRTGRTTRSRITSSIMGKDWSPYLSLSGAPRPVSSMSGGPRWGWSRQLRPVCSLRALTGKLCVVAQCNHIALTVFSITKGEVLM